MGAGKAPGEARGMRGARCGATRPSDCGEHTPGQRFNVDQAPFNLDKVLRKWGKVMFSRRSGRTR